MLQFDDDRDRHFDIQPSDMSRGRRFAAPFNRSPTGQWGLEADEKGHAVTQHNDHGFWDDDRTYASSPRRTRPSLGLFWSRLGIIGLVGAIAVPVAFAVSKNESLGQVPAAAAQEQIAAAPPETLALVIATVAAAPVSVEPSTTLEPTTTVEPITAPAPATTQPKPKAIAKRKAECKTRYTVVGGDSWILIAKKVGVSLKELLAASNSRTSTLLLPKQTVCLPANATLPKVVVAKPKPAVAKTAKPAKAAASPPTTSAKPRPSQPTVPDAPAGRSYSAGEVEQIIRDVWPDDLENQALVIAKRESNLRPAAHNSCCVGLFQIHWTANQRFLNSIAIMSVTMLYDPIINATAAYRMYMRNGWAPWS